MTAHLTQDIALGDIRESPANPRHDFQDLADLTASIKAHGVLSPILVRPVNGHHEIVFGHRRFRAAKAAGIKVIPAMVRELGDEQVLEAQIIENMQRQDLHPLEEADGYRQLHETHGHEVDELAGKVGKSKAYVYARLKLCALCEKARKLFFDGLLNPSTALLVARIPDPRLQAEAAKQITEGYDGVMSVREASEHLQRNFMLKLAEAPFAPADATLLPEAGACTTCPKRTGNEKLLFADVRSADVCTDPPCYQRKLDAHWERKKLEAEAKGTKILGEKEARKVFTTRNYQGKLDVGYGEPYVDLNNRCEADTKGRNWRDVLRKAKAEVPVVLARDGNGNIHELLTKADAAKVAKAAGLQSERKAWGVGVDNTWEKRRRAAEAKRKRERVVTGIAIERLMAAAAAKAHALGDAFWRIVAAGVAQRWWNEDQKQVVTRRGWMPEPGKGKRRGFVDVSSLLEKKARELEGDGLSCFLLEMVVTGGQTKDLLDEACKLFKVDLKKIDAEVKAAAKKKPKAKAKKPKGTKSAAANLDELDAAQAPSPPTRGGPTPPRRARPRRRTRVEEGVCRECGCDDLNACGEGCSWVEPDLCSACAKEVPL